jgi:uncharacterized protein (UPF0332 family)
MKDATWQLLDKATRAMHVAETLLRAGDVEFAIGRTYYAMFYVAEASLNERALRFRRHSRVHSAFSVHFVKSDLLGPKFHRRLLDAFGQQILDDYGIEATPALEDETHMLE